MSSVHHTIADVGVRDGDDVWPEHPCILMILSLFMYLIAGVLILGGNWLPAINSKHNSSFFYSDHGRRRRPRPPMDAFRDICSNDIIPNNVSRNLLSGYTLR